MADTRQRRARSVRLGWLSVLTGAAFVVGAAGAALAAEQEAEPTAPQRPVRLLGQRGMEGLYTWLVDERYEDTRGVYKVTDGVLRISGDGFGYIGTKARFQDYRLVVEFKWGRRNWRHRRGKARDSGIFLHATGPDGNSFDGDGAYMAAIECNVMEGAVGDILLIKGKDKNDKSIPIRVDAHVADGRDADGWFTWRRDGRTVTLDDGGRINWFGKDAAWKDTFGFRGKNDVDSPAGQWTRVECTCAGASITIKVNGRVVNQVFNVRPAAGRILLQCEGSEVLVRRFEVLPLESDDD